MIYNASGLFVNTQHAYIGIHAIATSILAVVYVQKQNRAANRADFISYRYII